MQWSAQNVSSTHSLGGIHLHLPCLLDRKLQSHDWINIVRISLGMNFLPRSPGTSTNVIRSFPSLCTTLLPNSVTQLGQSIWACVMSPKWNIWRRLHGFSPSWSLVIKMELSTIHHFLSWWRAIIWCRSHSHWRGTHALEGAEPLQCIQRKGLRVEFFPICLQSDSLKADWYKFMSKAASNSPGQNAVSLLYNTIQQAPSESTQWNCLKVIMNQLRCSAGWQQSARSQVVGKQTIGTH